MRMYDEKIGSYVTNVFDLEAHGVNYDLLKAIDHTYQEKLDIAECEKNIYKNAYEREELHSDALFQQNMSTIHLIDNLKNYVLDAKRMDRDKLISMLDECINQLENY